MFKKAVSLILIGMILCCSFPVFSAAEETSTAEVDYGYVPDTYERFRTDLSDGAVELAINYDPSRYICGRRQQRRQR